MHLTDKRRLAKLILCVPLGLAGAAAVRFFILLPVFYDELLESYPALRPVYEGLGMAGWIGALRASCLIAGALFVGSAVCGLLLDGLGLLRLLRKCYGAAYILFLEYALIVSHATGCLQENNLVVNGVQADSVTVFFWAWAFLRPAAAAVLLFALLHLTSWRRAAINAYTGESDPSPGPGDLLVENIRTHGADPLFRKSIWASLGIHVFVILILPWLLSMGGCVEDYRVPKGSGMPEVATVRVVKKKPKKKKYLLNPQSAILFNFPDLDDSPTLKDVEEMTQLTYAADPTRVLGGKLGTGGKGPGGWPDGMENAKVRFIRLEYNGRGWDDGMDSVSRADRNFLEYFRKLTGFKVAEASESHSISMLRKYRKGFAPPFVYMTGDGAINVTASEVLILREYLLDGGMLFADCGSPQWDRSFRSFVQVLFPGESLRVISDDDPIFQLPFCFPNGAPPLWHHGGSRAMGIKHQGRWVVFYHPGDINDAWKTGHSGMDPELVKGAYEMGVNIVYYAFTRYLELTRKYRK